MRALRTIGQFVVAGGACAALAMGTIALSPSQAEARPILLCGPTILWVCSGPGGPDVLFAGTICEKREFERSTGLTCVPFGG